MSDDWTTDRRKRLVFIGAVQLLVVAFNFWHQKEQSIVTAQYEPYALWLLGQGSRDVLTYPLWGYPAAIAALGSANAVLFLQALLAVPVLDAAVAAIGAACPSAPRLARGLVLIALPWYFLHAVRWPASLGATAGTAGLLLLAGGGWPRAVAGGLLLGLGGHFRSDWFLLAPALVVAAVLLRRKVGVELGRIALFAGLSWAALLPWALFTWTAAGVATPVSTNGGYVAIATLGQLPHNPWGARFEDVAGGYPEQVLAQYGGSGVDPMGPVGDRLLKQAWKDKIVEHPAAFALKCAWNLCISVGGGYYLGEAPLRDVDVAASTAVRDRIKALVQQSPVSAAVPMTLPAVLALAWFLGGTLAGAVFHIAALAGLVLRRRELARHELLWVFAVVVLYSYFMCGVFMAQPRHMNQVYLFEVPFAVTALGAVASRLRRTPAHA